MKVKCKICNRVYKKQVKTCSLCGYKFIYKFTYELGIKSE